MFLNFKALDLNILDFFYYKYIPKLEKEIELMNQHFRLQSDKEFFRFIWGDFNIEEFLTFGAFLIKKLISWRPLRLKVVQLA